MSISGGVGRPRAKALPAGELGSTVGVGSGVGAGVMTGAAVTSGAMMGDVREYPLSEMELGMYLLYFLPLILVLLL